MILSQMKSCCAFGGKFLDVVIHQHELRQRRHVKARARLVKRPHDGRLGVGFDGEVALHARQMLAERGVVAADFVVIHDH